VRRRFGLVGVGLLLAACGGSAGVSTPPATSPAPLTTPSPRIFVMQGVNDGAGKVTGAASVVSVPGSFSVILRLTGLQPNSSHVADLQQGGCPVGGQTAFPLRPVVADAAGNGISTTVLRQDYRVPAEGWSASVHSGPDLSTPQNAKAIACAELRAS
jgi:hypothetical protein